MSLIAKHGLPRRYAPEPAPRATRVLWVRNDALSDTVVRYCRRLLAAVLFLLLPSACTSITEQPPQIIRLSGGEATVKASGHSAFSRPSANMPLRRRLDFSVGNSFFRNPWVAAPATTNARDGLGPLFNTNGCQNCHIRDGRGHAPAFADDNAVSLLVRLSRPSVEPLAPYVANLPDPIYGGQIQDFSLPGIQPEAAIRIDYTIETQTLAGGEIVELRRPSVRLDNLAYGKLHPQTQFSTRIAPPMIGLGLLEAIDDKRLQQLADPKDSNADGISGRLNKVWDKQLKKTVIGRFGWKAGQPTLLQQNAAAFNGDLGITSVMFTQENCTPTQARCLGMSDGDPEEVSAHILNQVTFYSRNLAVPARRNPTKHVVLKGQQLFQRVGCDSCHTPVHTTASDYPLEWLAGQTIAPYTDLLLHDMGEGLADNTQEFSADGREWRTPPLWGIGLTKTVSGAENFLHDGRARTLQEAILWHGGEAQSSRDQYARLPYEDRQSLLAFLRDL